MPVEEAVKKSYQSTTPEGDVYYIAADFPAFAGHFEGRPILPAVCQLSFCVDSANRHFKKQVEVAAVKRAKFIRPILPETVVQVHLKERPDGVYFAELIDCKTQEKFSQIILQFTPRIS